MKRENANTSLNKRFPNPMWYPSGITPSLQAGCPCDRIINILCLFCVLSVVSILKVFKYFYPSLLLTWCICSLEPPRDRVLDGKFLLVTISSDDVLLRGVELSSVAPWRWPPLRPEFLTRDLEGPLWSSNRGPGLTRTAFGMTAGLGGGGPVGSGRNSGTCRNSGIDRNSGTAVCGDIGSSLWLAGIWMASLVCCGIRVLGIFSTLCGILLWGVEGLRGNSFPNGAGVALSSLLSLGGISALVLRFSVFNLLGTLTFSLELKCCVFCWKFCGLAELSGWTFGRLLGPSLLGLLLSNGAWLLNGILLEISCSLDCFCLRGVSLLYSCLFAEGFSASSWANATWNRYSSNDK